MPKILDIKESKYPDFTIEIEYGNFDNRKIESFEFEGVLQE